MPATNHPESPLESAVVPVWHASFGLAVEKLLNGLLEMEKRVRRWFSGAAV